MEDVQHFVLNCTICGGSKLDLKEGFYYCAECGVKQEDLRDIEIDREAEYLSSKHYRKQKVQKVKEELPNLTSWECYNYILRGLVERLLSLGAKEELKLITLQLWAAYMRKMEVAFFSNRFTELPRLGLQFLQRDAQILYNHKTELKKRKRNGGGVSVVSQGTKRDWRRAKKKLGVKAYSLHSASQFTTRSASTGTTGHAVQLKFSSKARKLLKKTMPLNHLKMHEKDVNSVLNCHKLRPKSATIVRSEFVLTTLTMKHIYSILAIALNLIGDDIQLSDLVQFLQEGHIGTSNVLQYFPDNNIPFVKKILHEIHFHWYPEKYSDKVSCSRFILLIFSGSLAKFINIRQFNKPDIFKLACRYITDLNLPSGLCNFIGRLITILPPEMETPSPFTYPAFEARAMAYIIFVMKLLFGLDGYKENLMSRSAQEANIKISEFSKRLTTHPKLFVWSEWVQFIEMRKVIVSHFNPSFCRQFKQCKGTQYMANELIEEQRNIRDLELTTGIPHSSTLTKKASNMKHILENLEPKNSNIKPPTKTFDFQPSLTPAHSYFKFIALEFSEDKIKCFKIPRYMFINHAERTMDPYLSGTALRKLFHEHNWHFKTLPIPCNTDRTFVGVFRADLSSDACKKTCYEADTNISKDEWAKSLPPDLGKVSKLKFKTEWGTYVKSYVQKHEKRIELLKHSAYEEQFNKLLQMNQKEAAQLAGSDERIPSKCSRKPPQRSRKPPQRSRKSSQRSQRTIDDILSMHSFEVFSEDNMNPIDNLNLQAPRRNLNSVNLFEGLSDNEENTVRQSLEEILTEMKNLEHFPKYGHDKNIFTLVKSKMDYWMLFGNTPYLRKPQKKILEAKFPCSYFWLLKTCAQTINVEWVVVYEQLVAIEMMFAYGIENLDDLKECIRYKYFNAIKEINSFVNTYRKIW